MSEEKRPKLKLTRSIKPQEPKIIEAKPIAPEVVEPIEAATEAPMPKLQAASMRLPTEGTEKPAVPQPPTPQEPKIIEAKPVAPEIVEPIEAATETPMPKLQMSSMRLSTEGTEKPAVPQPPTPQEPKAIEVKPIAPEVVESVEAATETPMPKLQMASMKLPTEDTEKALAPQPPAPNENPTALPPPLPTAPSLENPPADKAAKTDSPILSIVIIAGLFLILAVVAGGILFVLRPPSKELSPIASDPTQSQSGATTVTADDSPVSEPSTLITKQIGRAKQAIATVPVMETIPDISGSAPTYETETITRELLPAKSTSFTVSQETTAPRQTSSKQRAKLKEAASLYLTQIHIDGVRNGSNPKVMINAESYLVGEVVDEDTGLSFQGIKEGKLLFKDRNGLYYLRSF